MDTAMCVCGGEDRRVWALRTVREGPAGARPEGKSAGGFAGRKGDHGELAPRKEDLEVKGLPPHVAKASGRGHFLGLVSGFVLHRSAVAFLAQSSCSGQEL